MAKAFDHNQPFPLPPNEEERLRELYELDLLGNGRIEQVDRICALARDLFKVPVALVTLIDRDRQCFLSSFGIDIDGTQRKDALCNVAILSDGPLVIRDAAADQRFNDNVFVCGPPNIRFYAGAPLRLRPGINIGTLCIIDLVPRHFPTDDEEHLAALADMIVSELRGRRAGRDLAAGKRRLAQTTHMAKIGGYEYHAATNELIWDDEIYRIYGIPPEMPPSNELVVARYDPETRESSRRRLDALFTRGVPYDVELRGTRPNGEIFWVRAMAEAEFVDGKVHRIFGAVQDITERKLAETRIHELAYRDSLTSLPNRVSFVDKLGRTIEGAGDSGMPVTLIKFDVDHFREVNDALGQKTGDALLQSLANTLWQCFGSTGTVARIGGNEFAAILRGTDVDEAEKLAHEFLEQAKQLRPEGFALPLGISAGLAVCPEHGDDAESIINNAKLALLEAKARRRGGIVRFDPGMRETLDGKHALLRRVWAGIENNEFLLYYQPIVALRGGKVTGLEALMRWNDPEYGLLSPAHFMAAFEEPELSVALGDMALDLAIAQMRHWLDTGVEFGNVALNLTTAQFHRVDLAETILGKLARSGVPPQRLTLEVTENVYMAWGADVVAATIHKLHDAGVEIALDDFGTGYASLAHLRQFPIDKLKIDKSFVQSIDSVAIVDAVINMGLSLGMRVVAEGVEKPEQLSLLRLKGCDYVQGYIFAKPLAPDVVGDFIADFGAEASARESAAG
jgi:diguanylate cyclase (GGDEF)-like protein/PAS domain S-box-containing protein